MLTMPTIEMRSQMARIGMDPVKGRLELEQPKAEMDFQTTPAELDFEQPSGDLTIDQSKAWEALSIGSHLQAMNTIHSKVHGVALEAIGRIVERGKRLMAIHLPGNAIAELAKQRPRERHELLFAGPASVDNVDINYTMNPPKTHISRAHVDTEMRKVEPYIRYERGSLNIHMIQFQSLEIIPPQIDIKL